jgi:hypothetical protein
MIGLYDVRRCGDDGVSFDDDVLMGRRWYLMPSSVPQWPVEVMTYCRWMTCSMTHSLPALQCPYPDNDAVSEMRKCGALCGISHCHTCLVGERKMHCRSCKVFTLPHLYAICVPTIRTRWRSNGNPLL